MALIRVKFVTVTGTVKAFPGQRLEEPAVVIGASLAMIITGTDASKKTSNSGNFLINCFIVLNIFNQCKQYLQAMFLPLKPYAKIHAFVF
jgi:hypothetical protein